MQVIPAINATNFEAVKKQLEIAAGFFGGLPEGGWIHLDIVDGKFAPHITWGKAGDLSRFKIQDLRFKNIKLEAHLMVERPELEIEAWLENGIKRIIVHLEAMSDPLFILDTCRKYDAQAGLSINPATPIEKLTPHLKNFKFVQILAVSPGLAGQKLDEKTPEKIKFLRKNYKDVIIEVDGGINLKTAKLAKKAGADIIISASYIFGSKDPKKAYEELIKI
jgi:ribulose-phosphate 3-epimerase